MANVLLLTPDRPPAHAVLPALEFLAHRVDVQPLATAILLTADPDVVLVDARSDLAGARAVCRSLTAMGSTLPVIVVVTDAGLPALSPEWADHFVLGNAGPGEVEARLRLAQSAAPDSPLASRGVEIDEAAYAAKVDGRVLDLTYTEFELLRFFVTHPGRAFTRDQLLSEVWGHDYFGGTRTVDVHVRRLRAKLGESGGLISTVRNVGYRFG